MSTQLAATSLLEGFHTVRFGDSPPPNLRGFICTKCGNHYEVHQVPSLFFVVGCESCTPNIVSPTTYDAVNDIRFGRHGSFHDPFYMAGVMLRINYENNRT